MHIATAITKKMDPQRILDLEIIQLAAMLHDVEDSNYRGTPESLRAVLTQFFNTYHYHPQKRDQVIDIINHVSYSNELKNGTPAEPSMELCIVQDADRLDELGAVGIARAFTFGGRFNESLREVLARIKKKLPHISKLMKTDIGRQLTEERILFANIFIVQMENQLSSPLDI